tara:strand:+ start:397 stop:1140 length:744 start_codon:yes stop_codon:yes gene_type:complete
MSSVIYKIEITGSDRFYVGSAVDFHKRRLHHISQLRRQAHRNIHLQRIFDKHGEESLSFSILEECEKLDLIVREQYWIDSFPFDRLINICPTAGNTLGRIHTKETREKISKNHHDVSGENNPMFGTKGELSPNWGKKHSEETKRKISEANKGQEGCWKGKTREAHSQRMKGEGNPFFGKTHTDETKKRLSAAAKKREGKKITLDIAREIRYRYANEKITQTALAKEYGLSRSYCSALINGLYWREDD